MNAIWDAKRRKLEAPRKVESAKRPAKPKKHKSVQAAERLACANRSAEPFAKLDCNCKDKPDVFDCSVHGMCIVSALAKRPSSEKGHVLHGKEALHSRGPSSMAKYEPWFREGESVSRGDIEGKYRIAVCELCPQLQAQESPKTAPESTPEQQRPETSEPFPLAPQATAEARVVICRACDKRQLCGKPESAARWALESCPDGRWRAERGR